MNIAIDLDGVVFNSEMYFMAAAEIYDAMTLGKNSILRPEEPRVQNKYAWNEEELAGYISRFANAEDFDVMPCAKTVIDLLRKRHTLYVVSARGQFNEGEIEIAKRKLAEADITFDRYCFGHLDKTQIVRDNHISVMIDDRYDVCETLSAQGVFCIYFRMAGRKKLAETPFLREANNWGDVCRIMKDKGLLSTDEG